MNFDNIIQTNSETALLETEFIINTNIKRILDMIIELSKTICENKNIFRDIFNDNIRYCDYYDANKSAKQNINFYKQYRDDVTAFLLYAYTHNLIYLNEIFQDKELLESINDFVDDSFLSDLEIYSTLINSYINEKHEIFTFSELQSQHGKNIVIFFKSKGDSKTLIEKDLEDVMDTQTTQIYIKKILSILDSQNFWNFKQPRFRNFREDIRESENGNSYSFISHYSSKDCFFSRLKAPNLISNRKNDTRISCLKIDLCEENRIKLDIESNTIILILGLRNISNINIHAEYRDFRNQLIENFDEIQIIIKLFEDPETPIDVLKSILVDSDKIYKKFINSSKEVKKITY